jgi:NADPH:quinone reductase-like Zn-dependent oxidoreductase
VTGALTVPPDVPVDAPGGLPAAIIDAPGAAPRLGTVTLPPRGPGTTLVSVLATPLNPLDLVIASGTFHSARHELPYVPGSECTGTVIDSDRYPAGSLVYAECHASPTSPGTFATRVVVNDEDLLPLPEGTDPVLAAAVGNSGTAAFMPLIDDARLRNGETVLVLGATGAVGQLAIQVARQHGAGRVIGAGRNRAALDRLPSLGADAVIDLRTDEPEGELAGRLLAAAGPVDVVLDGLFGVPLQAALRVCAPRARVVNIGNLAGATAQLPAGLLRGKQLAVSGFAGLHTPLRDKQAALTWLWGALAAGTLRIGIRAFTLGDLAAAWTEQEASPHAKCVVLAEEALPAGPPFTPIRDDRSNRP